MKLSQKLLSLSQIFAGAAGFELDRAEPCRRGRTRAAGAPETRTSHHHDTYIWVVFKLWSLFGYP